MAPTASPSKRTLSTADVRRETVLEVGMSAFAERGFLGTPTTEIAKAAGISQAYLFRLFPTKSDLILAVIARSNERIKEAFVAAAAQSAPPARTRCRRWARPMASCWKTVRC